jgi:hypothetical protein
LSAPSSCKPPSTPKTPLFPHSSRVHLYSTATSTKKHHNRIASVVLIVFPFQNATNTPTTTATSPWATATFLAPLLTGLLSLGLLALWQAALAPRLHKQHNARLALALPPALLRNRVYAAAALHTLLTGFPYLLCVFAFPVRFQVVYGRSALQAGLMLLPMLAGTAVGTVLAGAVNGGRGKVRFLETLLVAAALMLLGCGLETTAEVGDGAVEPRVLGFLVFVGLGFGLSAAGGTMLAGAEAPVWEHGEFLFVLAFFLPFLWDCLVCKGAMTG